ncbi:uncharacterized protein V2V93DRAFT_376711 [Kockiozyma suomiensis]|uniref:uncharacterized protein n=1 Tax=Kockiozyma suomiensis TaxID=1337062 RepID=UPI0033438114
MPVLSLFCIRQPLVLICRLLERCMSISTDLFSFSQQAAKRFIEAASVVMSILGPRLNKLTLRCNGPFSPLSSHTWTSNIPALAFFNPIICSDL